jgi:hypothetical protein
MVFQRQLRIRTRCQLTQVVEGKHTCLRGPARKRDSEFVCEVKHERAISIG